MWYHVAGLDRLVYVDVVLRLAICRPRNPSLSRQVRVHRIPHPIQWPHSTQSSIFKTRTGGCDIHHCVKDNVAGRGNIYPWG